MKLKELRIKHGLLQREIAAQLGIASNTYSGYERGFREPALSMIYKLADIFEVTVDELLGRVPEQQLFNDARIPKTEIQLLFDSLTLIQQNLALAYMYGLADASTK